MQVRLGDVPAALERKLAPARPLLPQPLRNADELRALHIVQHNDVRPSVDRLVRLRFRPDLDLKEEAEPSDLARLLHRVCDRACSRTGITVWTTRTGIEHEARETVRTQ